MGREPPRQPSDASRTRKKGPKKKETEEKTHGVAPAGRAGARWKKDGVRPRWLLRQWWQKQGGSGKLIDGRQRSGG